METASMRRAVGGDGFCWRDFIHHLLGWDTDDMSNAKHTLERMKSGEPFEVQTSALIKWKPYRPGAPKAQLNKGGRWQSMNEYGGWDNCEFDPDGHTAAQDIQAEQCGVCGEYMDVHHDNRGCETGDGQ